MIPNVVGACSRASSTNPHAKVRLPSPCSLWYIILTPRPSRRQPRGDRQTPVLPIDAQRPNLLSCGVFRGAAGSCSGWVDSEAKVESSRVRLVALGLEGWLLISCAGFGWISSLRHRCESVEVLSGLVLISRDSFCIFASTMLSLLVSLTSLLSASTDLSADSTPAINAGRRRIPQDRRQHLCPTHLCRPSRNHLHRSRTSRTQRIRLVLEFTIVPLPFTARSDKYTRVDGTVGGVGGTTEFGEGGGEGVDCDECGKV